MRFDSRRLEATGTPVNVLDSIRSFQQIPDVTAGRDGTVLYVRGAAVQTLHPEITRVARDGSVAWGAGSEER